MSTPDWRNWIAGIVAAGGVAFCGWLTISISNLSGDTRAMRVSVESLIEDMQQFTLIESRLSALEKHAAVIGEAYNGYVPWREAVERRLSAMEASK